MKYLLLLLFAIVFIACGKKEANYDKKNCLTKAEEQAFLYEMVRYANKHAPEANANTMFNHSFDWYYDKAIQESELWWCYFDASKKTYRVFVSRDARSIVPMKEGIAIAFSFNEKKKLEMYQEEFRTWKMPKDTLQSRGAFLFQTWIEGGNLNVYTSKFQQDKFIEFPNDQFVFDTVLRRWHDHVLDSIMQQ
jgi:hypothetical protein